jgi:hypothetical protein
MIVQHSYKRTSFLEAGYLASVDRERGLKLLRILMDVAMSIGYLLAY